MTIRIITPGVFECSDRQKRRRVNDFNAEIFKSHAKGVDDALLLVKAETDKLKRELASRQQYFHLQRDMNVESHLTSLSFSTTTTSTSSSHTSSSPHNSLTSSLPSHTSRLPSTLNIIAAVSDSPILTKISKFKFVYPQHLIELILEYIGSNIDDLKSLKECIYLLKMTHPFLSELNIDNIRQWKKCKDNLQSKCKPGRKTNADFDIAVHNILIRYVVMRMCMYIELIVKNLAVDGGFLLWLDNCRTHATEAVIKICNECNVHLQFPPKNMTAILQVSIARD